MLGDEPVDDDLVIEGVAIPEAGVAVEGDLVNIVKLISRVSLSAADQKLRPNQVISRS